jgi:hypothetical protein
MGRGAFALAIPFDENNAPGLKGPATAKREEGEAPGESGQPQSEIAGAKIKSPGLLQDHRHRCRCANHHPVKLTIRAKISHCRTALINLDEVRPIYLFEHR